ncbi:MAG: hypothetical protein IPL10_20615 [Bacteroidetes bacterium]|nr:hypothetical protein [Bacteroidota bacterium]
MDKIELVRNNGVVNDSTSILSTYILQKDNSFCRVDTMEFKGFEPDKNQYSVMLVRIDTVKYVGGKIVIK